MEMTQKSIVFRLLLVLLLALWLLRSPHNLYNRNRNRNSKYTETSTTGNRSGYRVTLASGFAR